MHHQYASHSLPLALSGVIHIGAGGKSSGIYAEECQFSHKGVGSNLEGQRGERLAVACVTVLLNIGARQYAADSGNVGRRRHIVHNRVQQLLHALIAVGSTAGNGVHLVGAGGLADAGLELLYRKLLALKIFHHQVLVDLAGSNILHHFIMVFLRLLLHVLGDVRDVNLLAEIVKINIRLHLYQVDNSSEGILGTDRQLYRHGVGLQSVLHHGYHAIEIRAHYIHFVNICKPRNAVGVSLSPNGLALRLNTALSAEYAYRAVQHAQRSLNLYREVNVAGGVNNVYTAALPEGGRCGGGNGYTSFLLLNHPVHGGSAVMRLADTVSFAGVVQNTLRSSGLTGVNVRHNTDITGIFQ